MTCVLYLPITPATQNPQNQEAGVTSHADFPMNMALVDAHFTPPFRLIASARDSGSSGPGSGPGRGHCVVFLGKTLHSHGASVHPGV